MNEGLLKAAQKFNVSIPAPAIGKVPIVGRVAQSGIIGEFKQRKLELKALDYPLKETRAFVKQYAEKVMTALHPPVGPGTILLTVPSGSGLNKITILFAKELAKISGAELCPQGFVGRTHKCEAKNNLSLSKRLDDPINYKLTGPLKEFANGREVFIVDDVIGSGESCVRLKNLLQNKGIRVRGLVNLVTIDKSYPSEKDIERVSAKILGHGAVTPDQVQELKCDLREAFGEYTRQKLNRLEREIRDPKTSLRALDTIMKAASLEKKLKLRSPVANEKIQMPSKLLKKGISL